MAKRPAPPIPLRIFGTSIPKSGTHLLAEIFRHMGYAVHASPKADGDSFLERHAHEANPYVFGHRRHDPAFAETLRRHGYRVCVLIRDPRDICLSMADFVRRGQPEKVRQKAPELMGTPLAMLRRRTIVGFRQPRFRTAPIARICAGWKEWQDEGAVILRYEDIARSVVSGIRMPEVAALGLDPARFLASATACYKRGDHGGATFYRWPRDFDAALTRVWDRSARGVAASLGYEERAEA